MAADGSPGEHSPYARALLHWLERSPGLYFYQLLLHATATVIEDTVKIGAFQQPEMVVRGLQTERCLRGYGCSGEVHPLIPLGRRVALVIGDADYAHVDRLSNTINDAKDVAASLRRLQFAEVIERYNLGYGATIDALKEFGDKTLDADWAVVYFAGHGMEMNGITYLVPTDAKLARDTHMADEAVPLDRVLSKVETARRLRLVILDSCRNNPFLRSMVRTVASRSIGRGLAPIEPEGGCLGSLFGQAWNRRPRR